MSAAAGALDGYRLALSLPHARRLLLSAMLGRLPRGVCAAAILLLVHDTHGSFASAGIVVSAFGLANAAASPILGGVVDRYGQTWTVLLSAVLHSALLLVLALLCQPGASVPLLGVVAALAGAVMPPIPACARALWTEIADNPTAREAAFALDATTQEVIWTVGPLIVGACVALGSPRAAVLFAAAAATIGAIWFASAPLSRAWRPSRVARGSRWGAIASPTMRALILSVGLTGGCWGAVTVALPALAVEIASPALSGVLLAAFSIGSMAGGFWYGSRRWSTPPGRRYRHFVVALVALSLPAGLAGSAPVAILLALVAGLAWAPALACQYVLIGQHAPPGTLTESFMWHLGAFGAGMSLGAGLAGAVAEHSPAAGFGVAAAAALLALAVATTARDELDAPAAAPA